MKIVVVGGGTAGWLAAYFISKAKPLQHDITVIESSKIGIIGTGEASTGLILDVLSGGFFDKNYKIDIEDFMSKTDATRKMGIRHVNWAKKPGSYFAPIDLSPTGKTMNDYFFKYALAKFGTSKMHLASKIGAEYDAGNYNNIYALHFDGQKVSRYFKQICTKEDKVKDIDAIVQEVVLNEQGFISSIKLDNGKTVHGDLFIDCTGFARILMKKMDVNWISYDKILPVNSAIPFFLKHDSTKKIIPQITATALSSGWMWDTPLTTRRGCGYVFDDRFITPERAIQEIESVVGRKIEPIKHIKFINGSSEYYWKNNALCLGLSSSFMEPLEATSIHNTILQLVYFVLEFLYPDKPRTINEANQRVYNKRMSKLNNLTADFISMHYQGGREDSNFWQYIKNEKIVSENAKEIIDMLPHKIPGFPLLDGMWGSYSIPLANWIFAGIGLINQKHAMKDLIDSNMLEIAEHQFNMFQRSIIKT